MERVAIRTKDLGKKYQIDVQNYVNKSLDRLAKQWKDSLKTTLYTPASTVTVCVSVQMAEPPVATVYNLKVNCLDPLIGVPPASVNFP